ncbi:hypothetical protein Dimus_008657, partial [Dionaea muscipula]
MSPVVCTPGRSFPLPALLHQLAQAPDSPQHRAHRRSRRWSAGTIRRRIGVEAGQFGRP